MTASSSISGVVDASKTDREGSESNTDGSQDTESMPRASGLFSSSTPSSSSSVMRSSVVLRARPFVAMLAILHDELSGAERPGETADDVLVGLRNALAMDADVHSMSDMGRIVLFIVVVENVKMLRVL